MLEPTPGIKLATYVHGVLLVDECIMYIVQCVQCTATSNCFFERILSSNEIHSNETNDGDESKHTPPKPPHCTRTAPRRENARTRDGSWTGDRPALFVVVSEPVHTICLFLSMEIDIIETFAFAS